jgi:hypothetical protein
MLSAHLKGKDYRDLLEIIDLTYGCNARDRWGPKNYSNQYLLRVFASELNGSFGESSSIC